MVKIVSYEIVKNQKTSNKKTEGVQYYTGTVLFLEEHTGIILRTFATHFTTPGFVTHAETWRVVCIHICVA